MPVTKVIKPKAAGAPRTAEGPKREPVKSVPKEQRSRGSSCPRRSGGGRRCGAASRSCERGLPLGSTRTRTRTRTTCPERPPPAKGEREQREQREQRGVRVEAKSYGPFTVIPPDPEKRRDICRKAEAELAALEALRLSRAMAYISISPCSVGGCMSLEEVRLKQQQEMTRAKRKLKVI